MSLEKDKADIKEKYDKCLETITGKPVSKEEMTKALSGILEEYVEVPKFEAVEVEVLKDGKYPAIRYTIRRSE